MPSGNASAKIKETVSSVSFFSVSIGLMLAHSPSYIPLEVICRSDELITTDWVFSRTLRWIETFPLKVNESRHGERDRL